MERMLSYGNEDFCLMNHIDFCLDESYGLLFEMHGYYTKTSDIVRRIMNVVDESIKSMKNHKFTVNITDMRLFDGIDVFFDDISITIQGYNFPQKIIKTSVGGYKDNVSILRDDYCKPVITIVAFDDDIKSLRNQIYDKLGHELTHAYNDYIIFKKTSGKKRLGTIFPIYYPSDKTSDALKDLQEILYFINRAERNAFFAEIKQELESKVDAGVTYFNLYNTLKETDAYKNLKDVGGKIERFREIDDYSKHQVVAEMNNTFDKHFNNFNQVLKFLNEQWLNTYKKFNVTSSKIIADVFLEKSKGNRIDKFDEIS